jgi:hypothetical protein
MRACMCDRARAGSSIQLPPRESPRRIRRWIRRPDARARAHGNEIVPPIKEKKEKDKVREGKTALCKTVSRTERAVFHAPVRSDERARERHVICMIPRCISDWLMNRSELASSRPLVRGNRGNATGPRDPPTPSNLIVRAVSPGRRGQEGAGGGAGARAVDGSLLCRARCRRHGSPETHTQRERERERERERGRADSSAV